MRLAVAKRMSDIDLRTGAINDNCRIWVYDDTTKKTQPARPSLLPGPGSESVTNVEIKDATIRPNELAENAATLVYSDKLGSTTSLSAGYTTLCSFSIPVASADLPAVLIVKATGNAYGSTNSTSNGQVIMGLQVASMVEDEAFPVYITNASGITIGAPYSLSHIRDVSAGSYYCSLRGKRVGSVNLASAYKDARLWAVLYKRSNLIES